MRAELTGANHDGTCATQLGADAVEWSRSSGMTRALSEQMLSQLRERPTLVVIQSSITHKDDPVSAAPSKPVLQIHIYPGR